MVVAGPCAAGGLKDEPIKREQEGTLTVAPRDAIVVAQVAAGTSEPQAVVETFETPAKTSGIFERLQSFLTESYRREPALMVALALVFLLSPIVSVLLLVTQSAKRVIAQRKTTRGASLKQALQAAGTLATTTEVEVGAWPAEASLEFIDEACNPLPINGRMLRIGRHEENDVRLSDKTVHRHHAVLELTGEHGYTITDLSGAEGNGVLVNAERVTQARLRHGDIIELGAVKLRFALNDGKTSGRIAGQSQVTLH
jgi:pSer/pThr/pTyr-binding forkhead associated (FHA) protein